MMMILFLIIDLASHESEMGKGFVSMGFVEENLKTVEHNIAEACRKSKRNREDVTLIAVSKTKPVSLIMEAYNAGIREFGENKVQELVSKYEEMPKDIHWHMIGHLQTNKVKYIIDKAYLIHGVDSLHLANEISRQAVRRHITANILIEVNIAGEESKFGCRYDQAEKLAADISALPGICVRGLMTIAPYVKDPEENRQCFQKMRQLSVDITNNSGNNSKVNVLSMGMTGDYTVAIEEGASYVRVGTGIFGEREYH